MKVKPLQLDSAVEFWLWGYFKQEFLASFGGLSRLRVFGLVLSLRVEGRERKKSLKSHRIGKITTQQARTHHVNKESALFPPITPQISAYQSGTQKPIATAGLSRRGMMIIQGAAPKNIDAIPSSTSQSKMKKRGKVKNYSRRQLLLKQKAVMDKMLHVDARIEDLQNVFSGMELDRQQKIGASRAGSQNINQQTIQSQAAYQGIPQAKSDFYFPLTAHSVALPNLPQGLQIQGAIDHHPVKQEIEKKQGIPGEPTKEDESNKEPLQLPGMNNTFWQRRSSIAKFPSQKALRKSISEQQTTLPLLNINYILKVGQ